MANFCKIYMDASHGQVVIMKDHDEDQIPLIVVRYQETNGEISGVILTFASLAERNGYFDKMSQVETKQLVADTKKSMEKARADSDSNTEEYDVESVSTDQLTGANS